MRQRLRGWRGAMAGFATLAFGAGMAACDDEWKQTQLADQGLACLVPAEQGAAPTGWMEPDPIAAGDEVFVYVILDPCATDVCDRVDSSSCEATLDGEVIRVTSRATLATRTDSDSCPLGCLPVQATCSVGALPAGTYTVEHAGATRLVTLPGADPCPQNDARWWR